MIVYIMGYGRSGSTLIESQISERLGVPACGEMKYYFERGALGNEPCSCLQKVTDCVFWKDFNVDQKYAKKAARVTKGMDSSLFFLLNWAVRKAWLLSFYQQCHESLYEYVDSKVGARGFIDSSKMPARAFWLLESM